MENYLSKNYNDDIIKKRINHIILSGTGVKYHNTNLGDIVIDTLNLIYYIYGYDGYNQHITNDKICTAIEYIAKKIKKFFSGRIMFIIKDKNTALNTSNIRSKYAELAKKLKIYIYIAEKYDPKNAPSWKFPTWIKSHQNFHSLESRDDLATIILAKKYRCPILSNDNYSDNYEYKATIAPFKILEYNWFSSNLPLVEQYKPENLKNYSTIPNMRIKLDHIFMNGEAEAVKLLQ
jgi:hypothetical protein